MIPTERVKGPRKRDVPDDREFGRAEGDFLQDDGTFDFVGRVAENEEVAR
jgi:hypothetical protein